MDLKDRAVIVMLLCFCFTVTVTHGAQQQEQEQQEQNTKAAPAASPFWAWQKLRSFYALYSKLWSPATWNWQMLKQAYSRFIAPSLGFSKGGDEKDAAKPSNEKETTSSEQKHQNEL